MYKIDVLYICIKIDNQLINNIMVQSQSKLIIFSFNFWLKNETQLCSLMKTDALFDTHSIFFWLRCSLLSRLRYVIWRKVATKRSLKFVLIILFNTPFEIHIKRTVDGRIEKKCHPVSVQVPLCPALNRELYTHYIQMYASIRGLAGTERTTAVDTVQRIADYLSII